MRIHRRASRFHGSANSTPEAPPPSLLAPPPILEPNSVTPQTSHDLGGFLRPATTSEGLCELSRSPWELLDELSLSDPQEVDGLLDSYCVNMESRAFHFSSASMQVTSEKKKIATAMATTSSGDRAQQQTLKKAAMKENKAGQTQNNANVKKQEGEDGAAQTRKCKKNDGKGWNCPNKASHPNSLCEYHLMKKCSYLSIEFASPVEEDKVMVAAPTTGSKSKLSDSSNTQNKKPIKNYDAAEGFYYYNGFGLSRGKRHCGNHPNKEEEVEMEPSKYACPLNRAKADTKDVTSNRATTSDDNVCNNNKSGRNNVNMERNKNPWKLSRKPVKVRALMSL